MDKLSFVIPCYGSEQTLQSVVEEIVRTVQANGAYDYEIILINDSSPSGRMFHGITRLARDNPRIKGVDLSKNFGQHAAIMTGFRYVTGDRIVCLDDDGQTPPEEMFRLIDKMNEGYDIVFARYDDKKHSRLRNIGSRINDWMARYLLGKPKGLEITSYFACERFIIEEIKRYRNAYPYIGGLLLRTSDKIANAMVCHRERKVGTSGYTLRKLFSLWLNGFTAFSVKPLRVATISGAFCACAGFFYGLYIILKRFVVSNAPLGYSSTMAAILFVGGIILLMLGVCGEYLGRIYISINNAPQSVIRKTINLEGDSKEQDE